MIDFLQTDGAWERRVGYYASVDSCGKYHNSFGPAAIYDDGSKHWWFNGKLHRLDGPAVEEASGYKEWHANGQLHRLDGAAVIYPIGHYEWWLNGKLHRLDGAAVIRSDGSKEWWVDDVRVTKQDFPAAVISFLLQCDKKTAMLVEEQFE